MFHFFLAMVVIAVLIGVGFGRALLLAPLRRGFLWEVFSGILALSRILRRFIANPKPRPPIPAGIFLRPLRRSARCPYYPPMAEKFREAWEVSPASLQDHSKIATIGACLCPGIRSNTASRARVQAC
jgi:hypothetical protein